MRRSNKLHVVLVIIAVICVLVTVTTVTWAWVAYNKRVDSNGIQMTIEASANLVISDSASTIATYTSSNWADSYVVKFWSDSALELIPADHYDSSAYTSVTGSDASVGLVYNSNPENVNRTTGKGEGLTFAYVTSDGLDVYYIDKVVYIASLDKSMEQGTDYSNIVISITETNSANGTGLNTAYKSASVDVYVSGTYKGTLNLDTLSSITVSDVTSIPRNTSSCIPIVLRCYFDGALQDATDASKNYVNSRQLSTNTANITFNISIVAS